jgi:hypothetical protein
VGGILESQLFSRDRLALVFRKHLFQDVPVKKCRKAMRASRRELATGTAEDTEVLEHSFKICRLCGRCQNMG